MIVPLYNEEQIIDELTERLIKSAIQITEDFKIIFVDDGSKDLTMNKVILASEKDSRIKHISFSRNFGHQVAVCAGLDHCVENSVVIIDGDLQDPPELIPEMYEKHKQGFEVVYARRISRKGESFFKKMTAKLFYRIFRRLVKIDFPIDTGDFRLIDKKVVDKLKLMPEKTKFLRGQIAWIGYRQTFVEFERDEGNQVKPDTP